MVKSRSGFTVIELLIVIVVIAILAAITIVAYNGIQTRSRNSAITSVISSYVKALKLYEGEVGAMPEAGVTTDVYRCVGEAYPSGCGTISGPTGCGLGNVTNANSLSFNTSIRKYLGNVSSVPRVNETGLECSTGGVVAGAMYIYRGATSGRSEMYYLITGNASTCVVPGGSTLAAQQGTSSNTLCRLYLN